MQTIVLLIIILIIMFFIEKKLRKNKAERRQAENNRIHEDYIEVKQIFNIVCLFDIRRVSFLTRIKLLFKPKIKIEKYFPFGNLTKRVFYKELNGDLILIKYDKGRVNFPD